MCCIPVYGPFGSIIGRSIHPIATATSSSNAGVLSIPVFLIDAVQMRGDVDANAVTAVNVATGSAVFKIILAILIGGGMAWSGWHLLQSAEAET